MAGEDGSGFGESMKGRMVEEFVVSIINGSLKPNLAEKNPANGREIEFQMDGPQLERTRKADVRSYTKAVGTGYQYRVVYKDRRFSELDRLVQVYSGTLPAPDEGRQTAEQRLYELVILMIKEGRLPKTFQVQSTREVASEKLASVVEEVERSLEELGRRVRRLEEQLAVQAEARERDGRQGLAQDPTLAA